jgi:hypothetical protein
MSLKTSLIALAASALLAPVAFADGLTLRVEARELQAAPELKVKLTCVDDPCVLEITGKARVGTRKFDIRPKERSLDAGEPEQVRLRIVNRRKLRELLADRDGSAIVKARATNDDDASAKVKIEITLKG